MAKLTTIAFDADDTLWHNEHFYRLTQARFAELLADHADPDHLEERLVAAERRNIGHYGFGIKGFMLSMIESALETTENRVPGHVIAEIIQAGQEMLQHPVELLPHAQEVLEGLAGTRQLLLITKGDLLDQERKVAASGLGEIFDAVEIVSDKTPEVYARIFADHCAGPEGVMMVGNSMKSDVLPAIAAGAFGVFVPQELAWDFEHAEAPEAEPKYRQITDLAALPDLISEIEREIA